MANKLYEYMSPEQSRVQISESQDGKDLFMQGLFIQGEVKNQKILLEDFHELLSYLRLEKLKIVQS